MNPYAILFGQATSLIGSIARVIIYLAVGFAILIYLGYDPVGMIQSYLWEQLIGDVIP